MTRARDSVGVVYLVGAGPGAPDLITIRGKQLLRRADVVVYDRLIDTAVLRFARRKAELIDVGKKVGESSGMQDRINGLLVARARAGLTVVRLKGGDPTVFGRGFEEASYCRAAGVPTVVVPGVSSVTSVAPAAGSPITHRGVARSIGIVSGETCEGDAPVEVDAAALARLDTVVVIMGLRGLAGISEALVQAGRDPDTPAVAIQRGTMVGQRIVRATLGTIAAAASSAGLCSPVITMIGKTAGLGGDCPQILAGPLMGRRIVLTRPSRTPSAMFDVLGTLGAEIIRCPTVAIETLPTDDGIAHVLENLHTFDWMLLTSANGARAWRVHMRRRGIDGRVLGGCRIGVVGPATARAVRSIGLRPDLVARDHSADGMIRALRAAGAIGRKRFAVLRSTAALPTLVSGLVDAGGDVTAIDIYANRAVQPAEGMILEIARGVDMIVFCSPSAVDGFVGGGLAVPVGAAVACLGRTTAGAARRHGMAVDVVPHRATGGALVAAIIDALAPQERGA